jgi:hypothetical protein
MKVYSLVGGFDYEGENLLGVFASKEDLLQFVEQEKSKQNRRPDTLGYDTLGYVESELGQSIDFYGEVEYL